MRTASLVAIGLGSTLLVAVGGCSGSSPTTKPTTTTQRVRAVMAPKSHPGPYRIVGPVYLAAVATTDNRGERAYFGGVTVVLNRRIPVRQGSVDALISVDGATSASPPVRYIHSKLHCYGSGLDGLAGPGPFVGKHATLVISIHNGEYRLVKRVHYLSVAERHKWKRSTKCGQPISDD